MREKGRWFNSPDCCACKICKNTRCLIWADGRYALHICAAGCDGIPDSVRGVL